MTDMTDMTEITPPSALPARLRALVAGLCLAPRLALSAGPGQIFGPTEKHDSLALSPDGKSLYVSKEDDALLSAFYVASGRKVFEVEVGEEPEGVKASADGKH